METLQNYEPVSPDEITQTAAEAEEMQGFEERVFEHLKSDGVKTGVKGEQAVFVRVVSQFGEESTKVVGVKE